MDTSNKNIDCIVKDPEKKDENILISAKLQDTSTDNALSKRQLKKIKKREKWLKLKPEKRLRERAKAKEKRAFARANNLDLGPSRKFLKSCTMADSSCKLNVTIDLSFDEFMISKDIAKLIKQILRCYTLNRRAIAPLQFSLTSFTGKSLDEMGKHNGYEHWDVKFCPESYLNIFSKDKIMYLTSESENIIEELNNDYVYVIGGLVDHNCQKGLCHRLAISNNVKHGRLPLDKFLQMKARKVLTVNHVFEIILKVTEGKTWQEAFLEVLPERKNAQPVSTKVMNNLDELQNQSETEEVINDNS
ncbi:PREDICTED: tRNA methyltransferase 10 homolog A [Ceratosolen solmsi marchali]|uniref:tRNA (guanine(9)-N(1))-methyltransferase n=1 Tax=Ceratosolen solmsi marchali TaxID=326594 RepID=A0AAJ6YG71_9HYME|nr:PREDICTED: tRNA methyltransferase 10 homolog A [Ceratosolen solmsi marchali]